MPEPVVINERGTRLQRSLDLFRFILIYKISFRYYLGISVSGQIQKGGLGSSQVKQKQLFLGQTRFESVRFILDDLSKMTL